MASSPFGVDGFFADIWHTVEKGGLPEAICAQAATLEMRPGFATAALELERKRDPDGFRAEYLAEFVAAGGSFLDPLRIEAAVRRGGELQPGDVVEPVAAVDLAFERDSSALAVVGRHPDDEDLIRLALARSWTPQRGKPLSFGVVLDEIADLARAYGARDIYLDQFSAAAATEHLRRRGLRPKVIATTAQSKSAMFVDLKTRLYEEQIELYEQPELACRAPANRDGHNARRSNHPHPTSRLLARRPRDRPRARSTSAPKPNRESARLMGRPRRNPRHRPDGGRDARRLVAGKRPGPRTIAHLGHHAGSPLRRREIRHSVGG